MPMIVSEARSTCLPNLPRASVFVYGDEPDPAAARVQALDAAKAWVGTKGLVSMVVLGQPRFLQATAEGRPLSELLDEARQKLPNGTATEHNKYASTEAKGVFYPAFVIELTKAVW